MVVNGRDIVVIRPDIFLLSRSSRQEKLPRDGGLVIFLEWLDPAMRKNSQVCMTQYYLYQVETCRLVDYYLP